MLAAVLVGEVQGGGFTLHLGDVVMGDDVGHDPVHLLAPFLVDLVSTVAGAWDSAGGATSREAGNPLISWFAISQLLGR
jgi:hypothetical protein